MASKKTQPTAEPRPEPAAPARRKPGSRLLLSGVWPSAVIAAGSEIRRLHKELCATASYDCDGIFFTGWHAAARAGQYGGGR